MTPNEYQQAALGTDGDDEFYMAANCRLGSHWAGFDKMRLLHASVGLCTEAKQALEALEGRDV